MSLLLPSLPIALLLAMLIGLSLGLLGSGGGIITLPVLVYVAGVPSSEAVALSLAIVGVTSLLGAIVKGWQREIDWSATLWFAVAGALGAFPGSYLTHLVSESTLTFIFGVLMLVVGVRMMLGGSATTDSTTARPWWLNLATGFVIGVLTGFLGVGGGFLIVPALVMITRLDMHKATGTSLVVIAINSFSGLFGHLSHESFNWPLAAEFLAAAVTGMLLTSVFASQVSDKSLRRMFAWLVLGVGGWVLVSSIA